MNLPSKVCESCGRLIEYRKKWSKNWEQIKYCSDECRKNKSRFDFKEAILSKLAERQSNATICPSEVLPETHKQDKLMMEHVRRSARLLAAEGLIEVTQSGRTVDPMNFKGPIRLRLKK
jgi:hypothetical protein